MQLNMIHIKNLKFSNQEQLQNYINQYKNIKELVTDSKVNNSQLKSMIEFLSEKQKVLTWVQTRNFKKRSWNWRY